MLRPPIRVGCCALEILMLEIHKKFGRQSRKRIEALVFFS